MSDHWVLTPVGTPGKRRRRGFVERTLNGISEAFEQSIFAEELARQPGLLQQLDPRAKLIGFLLLLLAASLAHSIPALLALYAVALGMSRLGRIPLGFFLKRVWLLLPFFTAFMAIPLLFNVVIGGEVLLPLPFGLAITKPGVATAALLVLRVGTSFSFALLLILTTPWPRLLQALRVLHVPSVFVLILGMTYRYIYLLLHTANNMFLSRKSRVLGRLPESEARRWMGAAAGTLLTKSYQLSNDVYLAMISRGYRGEPKTLTSFHMGRNDWLWLVSVVVVAGVVLTLERLLLGY